MNERIRFKTDQSWHKTEQEGNLYKWTLVDINENEIGTGFFPAYVADNLTVAKRKATRECGKKSDRSKWKQNGERRWFREDVESTYCLLLEYMTRDELSTWINEKFNNKSFQDVTTMEWEELLVESDTLPNFQYGFLLAGLGNTNLYEQLTDRIGTVHIEINKREKEKVRRYREMNKFYDRMCDIADKQVRDFIIRCRKSKTNEDAAMFASQLGNLILEHIATYIKTDEKAQEYLVELVKAKNI